VVAPHPDDEIFGAAGLIQAMHADRVDVVIVAVTDGEGSHPVTAAKETIDLRSVRRAESSLALERLGVVSPLVTRLGLPDGRVGGHVNELTCALADLLSSDDLCLAPWWHDGHPDHDACGRAALVAAAAAGTDLLGYFVWAWHWAEPEGSDLPWGHCRRFDFDRKAAARKRWATGAFRSQTRPWSDDHNGAALLPATVLRRFWRPYEVFVDASGGPR